MVLVCPTVFQIWYIIVNAHNSAVIELQNISHTIIMMVNCCQREGWEIRLQTLKFWSSHQLYLPHSYAETYLITINLLPLSPVKFQHTQPALSSEINSWFQTLCLILMQPTWAFHVAELAKSPILKNLNIFIWMSLPLRSIEIYLLQVIRLGSWWDVSSRLDTQSRTDRQFQHTHRKKKIKRISGKNSSLKNLFKNLQVDVLEKYFH